MRKARLLAAGLWIAALIFIPTSGWNLPAPSPTYVYETELEEEVQWTAEELQKPPNIIIVLSEAFWDVTQLPGLQFSRDPLPMYHALQKQYTSGTMLSPMFGGGTANVEFEVLTGHSYRFFPESSIVYEQYIKHPTASIASLLKQQGYATTAISPFHGWYFNSTDVYKHLGFSQFISLEYFNPDEYVGPYIGDHAVALRVLEQLEATPGQDFIFANTMENHYHYWPGKFDANTIEVKGRASKRSLGLIETYAQGASGADRMLQELVIQLNRLREPTILVFFGDHLPSLEKYDAYTDTGYIKGEDDPDFWSKMYEVPVLVWNNYMPRGEKDHLHISPSFLGPYVLKHAKLNGNDYTDYLNALASRMPLLPPKEQYESLHIDESTVKEYEQKQQAILERELQQAAALGAVPSGAEPAFTLGYGKPVIDRISPQQLQHQKGKPDAKPITLTVEGGRFGLGCKVYAAGVKLKTTWRSEQKLEAVLPVSMLSKHQSMPIEVKVIDSKEKVLATSAPVPFEIIAKP
ncbi:LTA synthase family protein [Paenibacillus sp. YYML68]|uniref:LTA synthase family protein n=1 Tax=Paenibacillus sp. YYML68 TaxID=2909250 RepID=UPI002493BBE6|nr:LTA synthase family protein [Paenibacillus sp. YYML68]